MRRAESGPQISQKYPQISQISQIELMTLKGPQISQIAQIELMIMKGPQMAQVSQMKTNGRGRLRGDGRCR